MMSKTGSSKLELTNCWKCFKYSMKISSVIHPLSEQQYAASTGPHFLSRGFIRFLSYINKGGTYIPKALNAQTTVMFLPLSQLVTKPTCFSPLWAKIFPGFCTVEIPVSSTLKILDSLNLYLLEPALSF